MTRRMIVVGAGFSGLTAARVAAESGYEVEVFETRQHLGGNAYDCLDAQTGVRYHPYGPHLFHTNSDKVMDFLSRFTRWTPYRHKVRAETAFGRVQFPINLNTLRAVYPMMGLQDERLATDFIEREGSRTGATDDGMNGVMRRLVGDTLFETFYKGYSEKQWGRKCEDLPAPIAKRVPIRFDYRDGYFDDRYQALPADGYSGLFREMIRHPRIRVHLCTPVGLPFLTSVMNDGVKVVYTGPLDGLLGHALGELEYRSLRFEWVRDGQQREDVVLNYPSGSVPWTRETEFGLLPNSPAVGASLVCREFPSAVGAPYYPVPDAKNRELAAAYKAEIAARYPGLMLCGRLAEYRYYNMDQAVASALSKIGGFL